MSLLAATPLARCPRRLPRFEQGFSLLLRAVAAFASQAIICPTKQPVPVVRQIFEPRVRTCRHLYRMSTCNAYCAGQPHAQHTTVSFASPIARLARHASHSTPRTAHLAQHTSHSTPRTARLAQLAHNDCTLRTRTLHVSHSTPRTLPRLRSSDMLPAPPSVRYLSTPSRRS